MDTKINQNALHLSSLFSYLTRNEWNEIRGWDVAKIFAQINWKIWMMIWLEKTSSYFANWFYVLLLEGLTNLVLVA